MFVVATELAPPRLKISPPRQPSEDKLKGQKAPHIASTITDDVDGFDRLDGPNFVM